MISSPGSGASRPTAAMRPLRMRMSAFPARASLPARPVITARAPWMSVMPLLLPFMSRSNMRTNGMTIALFAPWASANGEAPETHHEGAHGGLMGTLTTHVLDTTRGRPGAGVRVELYRFDGETGTLLAKDVTNRDGRTDKPLAEADRFIAGTYQIVFYMGEYFGA